MNISSLPQRLPFLPLAAQTVQRPATGLPPMARSTNQAPEAVRPAYLTRPPANEQRAPLGMEPFRYGSRPLAETPLITKEDQHVAIVGAHGTPPIAGELSKAGLANFANPDWMKLVANAVEQNGGLGNSEEGFLAFSSEMGFVRLRHPGMSPEQNRRLAALSLQTGWPIERLPCRKGGEDTLNDSKSQQWVEEFLGKSETALRDFVADPSKGLKVMDGSRNGYVMQFDPQSGAVFSGTFRKKGGFGGFVQKHMKYIAPVLDGISLLANAVPGLGTAFSAGAQLLKSGLAYAATGTLKAGQLISSAAGFLGSAFSQSFGFLNSGWGKAMTKVAADVADDGKLSPLTVASAFGPLALRDLPGGPQVDLAAQRFALVAGKAIAGGKITTGDIFGALQPILADGRVGADTLALFQVAAKAIDTGRLKPAQVIEGLMPLLPRLSDDPETQRILGTGLRLVGGYLEDRRFTAQDFVKAAQFYLQSRAAS